MLAYTFGKSATIDVRHYEPLSTKNMSGTNPTTPKRRIIEVPLDRNAKVRVMMLARALMRRTEKGKHYGIVTAKFVDVLRGVLWGVHNAASGRCFPSYEAIAEAAACSRTTAAPSGCSSSFLTWVNRIKRVREWVPGLFGKVSAWRWRVIRTSNAYAFTDPQTSKFNFQTGTTAQAAGKREFASNVPRPAAFAAPMVVWDGLNSTGRVKKMASGVGETDSPSK